MKTLIKNIRQIAGITGEGVLRKTGAEMSETSTLDNAWILIDNDRIAGFGTMENMPGTEALTVIDAEGGMVIPAFCDPHTHIVFAGTREREFLDKIEGRSYAEIAANGGGILNSADLLHRTSEDELYRQAMERVGEMVSKGTGAIEIKSGYGLTTEDELKILRVIRRIRETSPAIIRATFLGAHAVGRAFAGRQEEYVDYVCREMIPAVAAGEGDVPLADFIDVFCEDGFFTVAQTDRILSEGERYGMRVKLHANQLAVSGGVQVGVRHNALSVDHLESTTDAEIIALGGLPGLNAMSRAHAVHAVPASGADGYMAAHASDRTVGHTDEHTVRHTDGRPDGNTEVHTSDIPAEPTAAHTTRHTSDIPAACTAEVPHPSATMPTMLPGASFFLRMQYGRALDFINSGLGIALASDYNPGSSPCGDMRFIMALGCIQMRLTPVQALNACTLNAAYAMGISDIAGSVTTGKLANLIITKPIPSLTWIPYCHHTPFISKVLLRGRPVVQ